MQIRSISPVSFTIRRATTSDVEIISAHRSLMFADMGGATWDEQAEARAAFTAWLPAHLEREDYLGWLAEVEGGVIASVGMWRYPWPPTMTDLSGARRAYIMNVYTDPAYRRQGIARALMTQLLAWSREQGMKLLLLHASEDGQALYQSLGFQPRLDEMRITFE
jgi:GNAT superfamily N-acetyltransferase